MSSDALARDLYLRTTATDGTVTFSRHRVWDADLFIAARMSDAQALNAKVAGDGLRLATAQAVTEAQYKARKL